MQQSTIKSTIAMPASALKAYQYLMGYAIGRIYWLPVFRYRGILVSRNLLEFKVWVLALRYVAPLCLDTNDNDSRTPLSWVTRIGREDIVQRLLEKEDVISDTKDNDNRTPLSWAARTGRERIVNMLEQQDATPDTADKSDRTPLP